MLLKTLLLFIFIGATFGVKGFVVEPKNLSTVDSLALKELVTQLETTHGVFTENILVEEPQKVKHKRAKVIILTVLTGFLGGHRIYLGTHQRTPIIYSITFGGFGILPLIDLVHLIFTKDISIYENNTQIMMWRKE